MMKTVAVASLFAAIGCATLGCGSSQATINDPRTEAAAVRNRVSTMSVEQATKVVADFEAKQALRDANDPLRQPKSLEDVLEILKRDQTDLFEGGVKFAAGQEGVKALTLRAQMEIAWGEDQLLLAQLIDESLDELTDEARYLRRLAASGAIRPDDKARLDLIESTVADANEVTDALTRIAQEHVKAGAVLAEELVKTAPTEYQGYRVAADYFHVRGDWAKFDAMIKEVEAKQPDSVGLIFLKGVAAAERDGDLEASRALLRAALGKDPKFTRAQAQLVLLADGPRDTFAEFERLKAMNPRHQVVVFAGPAVTQAYEAQRERSRRLRERNEQRAPSNAGR